MDEIADYFATYDLTFFSNTHVSLPSILRVALQSTRTYNKRSFLFENPKQTHVV